MPLRRADRLFDILRILRSATGPLTAAAIADQLAGADATVSAGAGWPRGSRITSPAGVEGL